MEPRVLRPRRVHLPLLPRRPLRHRHKRRLQHKERRSPARPPKRRRRRVRRHQMQVRLRQQFQQALLPPHRLRHQAWQAEVRSRLRAQPPRRGRSRQRACRRCIPLRGIMCISMRRAASISIRTCRRTGSFTRNDALLESVPRMHCNFPVPMRHPQAGRLFPRTMQNVWLPI